MKIKVIGAGGIGTALIEPLARFLNYSNQDAVVTIIDGDFYEEKNQTRQIFQRLGNKAEVAVERLAEIFPNVKFRAKVEYLTPDSVEYLLEDGDIIFMCVDNHSTRNLVSGFCEGFENIIVISGGNDYTDGNIQVYRRKDGAELSLPIANKFHPEILEPEDRRPDEIGCDEAVEAEPQLIFTNLMIAAVMLNAFYCYLEGKLHYDEVYVDILTNNCRAVVRNKV